MQMALPTERQWLTAAEAAAEGLPDVPSERALRMALSDGSLKGRKRAGRGGGREFHWSDLPPRAREEYLKRYGIASADSHTGLDPEAKEAQKDLRAEARAKIVEAAQRFIADHSLPIGKGLSNFAKLYKRQRVKLEPWVHTVEPEVAPHQLRLWQRTIASEGTSGLIDRRGRPEGTGLFERDQQLRNYVVAQIAARPHLSAPAVHRAIRVDLQREVSLRTLQAFLSGFRKNNAPALKALSNPDQHRSHHKPAFGSRSEAIVRINQRWEIDATRGDAMCRLPDGRMVRYALTGAIDVFTRRAMILVSDQPRAAATQALLRRAILAWGMPEQIKADNGKEFTARAVERFCQDAGIELSYSRPFTPEEKPHIERFFGTLLRGFFEQLPGYVGHNIAERKGIESRASFAHRFGEEARLVMETALSPADLQARIDSWLINVYEQTVHEGIRLSPHHKALANADQVRRLPDERALDALLFDAPDASGIRTVGKKGIPVGRRYYIAAELGQYVGYRVHVRRDPHDAGRIVVYSDDRQRFICVAEDPDMTGADRIHIAAGAQKNQREMIRRVRDDARKVQRLYPSAGLADRLLTDANGAGFVLEPEAERGMIAAGPRLIAHTNMLRAIDEAGQPPQPIEPTAEEQEGAAVVLAEFAEQDRAADIRMVQCEGYTRPHFGEDDVGFWNWAEKHVAEGNVLDAEDARLIEELRSDVGFKELLNNTRRTARATA